MNVRIWETKPKVRYFSFCISSWENGRPQEAENTISESDNHFAKKQEAANTYSKTSLFLLPWGLKLKEKNSQFLQAQPVMQWLGQ